MITLLYKRVLVSAAGRAVIARRAEKNSPRAPSSLAPFTFNSRGPRRDLPLWKILQSSSVKDMHAIYVDGNRRRSHSVPLVSEKRAPRKLGFFPPIIKKPITGTLFSGSSMCVRARAVGAGVLENHRQSCARTYTCTYYTRRVAYISTAVIRTRSTDAIAVMLTGFRPLADLHSLASRAAETTR